MKFLLFLFSGPSFCASSSRECGARFRSCLGPFGEDYRSRVDNESPTIYVNSAHKKQFSDESKRNLHMK